MQTALRLLDDTSLPGLRKLLLILNAMVRDQVPWQSDRMPMAREA